MAFFSAAGAFAQGKKETLAIGKIEAIKALTEDMQRKGKLIELQRVVQSLDGQFISALGQTRKFTLVGRSDLADLLKEQDLGESGIVDASTAAEKGKVLGAKYRVIVTVDSFLDENKVVVIPETNRKVTRRRFQLSAQAKIYDATTSALLDSPNFQLMKTDASSSSNDGTTTSDAKETDELMPAIARELAEKVAGGVVDFVFPAKVLKVDEKVVFINRGQGTGIKEGEVWNVFGPLEVLKDPDTGDETKIPGKLLGKVRISAVNPSSSQGEIIEGAGIGVGSVLSRSKEAPAAAR